VKGDIERLLFPPGSFDCALMSLLMHHLPDALSVFRGVHQVLRPGGLLLLRQGTLEEIVDDVVHRFCPEAVTVDRRRTPFRIEITRWLEAAGFVEVEAEQVAHTVYETHGPVLEEFRLRVPSVLHLVPDEAWRRALARAEEYVAQHPDDPWLRQGKMTLFRARKPR
jgi:SAM-dependent methyltransferase